MGTLTSSELQFEPFDEAPPESPVMVQPDTVDPFAFTVKDTVSLRPFDA
jgi:hypothetical protein